MKNDRQSAKDRRSGGQNWTKKQKIHTEPVVHPEIRNSVPHQEVGPAKPAAEEVETSADERETKVAEEDEMLILSLIQGGTRVKVVDTAKDAVLLTLTLALRLAGVVVVAGDVGDEIGGPAEELLGDQVDSRGDGGLLRQLGQLVGELAEPGCVLLLCTGNEDHITGQVSGSFVVLSMGDLPREVRDQEQRVTDPADGVVEDLVG